MLQRMRFHRWRTGNSLMKSVAVLLPGMVVFPMASLLWAQTAKDPGVRGGAAGAGGYITILPAQVLPALPAFTAQFAQTAVVTGGTVGGNGLGPRFNSTSCASCHAQPAPGGSSPSSNPLFSVYQLLGAKNTMPAFELNNGPILTARFPYESDLVTPDGHAQQLFVITGRSDAGACSITQPNFSAASRLHNLQLRQPSPAFGDGYIEVLQDVDILNNMNANLPQKQALGISGHPNVNGDGSYSRLGWKAQWRSVLQAAGIEEGIETGITNEMFTTEDDQTPSCLLNAVPEDGSNYAYEGFNTTPWVFDPAAERDAHFIRFSAAPTPGTCPGGVASSCTNGQTQFNTIGCVLCHTQQFTTPADSIKQMGHITINLYSDVIVHHMGPCLADNIVEGTAQGDEFRTAPLWNVGQRIWFMHDGRTSDIVQAVEDHYCVGNSQYPASEANAVVNAFNALNAQNQQDLINFLRSL